MFSFLSKLWNRTVGKDHLVWHKKLRMHSCGEYSFAAAQASREMDDCSQVETGHNAMFVGIYDAHGGRGAASYLNQRLFDNVTRCARADRDISEETLRSAVAMTETEYLHQVRNFRQLTPQIIVTGSCCLIGVIWKETLLIGNLGDSRAVMGIAEGPDDRIVAQQLTIDHNVNQEAIRQEVLDLNQDDPNIVVHRDGRWRIKDILEVSRSVGDFYLKSNEFRGEPIPEQYQFPGPDLERPAISATPFMYSRGINPADRFLILASRGLWDMLTIQEAVHIVNTYPKKGIAKRLIKTAQKEAARRANMGYRNLLMIGRGPRRDVHDDMTVVVVFIDHELVGHSNNNLHGTSIKGFGDTVGRSDFYNIHDLM